MLASFLAAVFFALSAIFAQRATRMVGVFSACLARLWIAGALLGIWAHGFGSGLHGPGLPVFLISGAVGFGMGDLALFAALPLLGSRLTALMVQCLAAPMAALIEWCWLGTKLDAPTLLCGLTILVGVGIAIAPERRVVLCAVNELELNRPHDRRGILFGIIAALGQAGGAVISRKAHALSEAAGSHVDGGSAAYQRALGGLVIVTAATLFSRHHARAFTARWKPAWPWILANSLAGATVGVSCYQWALATTPSAVVMPVVALTPLIVVPFAYVIEHERPSARSVLGGMLAVAAAVVLAYRR